MKHLFFVHSHICFAITSAIIDECAIAPGDVLLITDRKYAPPDQRWTTVECPPDDWFGFEKNVSIGRQRLRHREDFVSTHGGDAFEYYCPHTYSAFNDFMARHRRCKAYHLIEEGTNSYLTRSEVDAVLPPFQPHWKRRVWSALFYDGLERTRSFIGPGPERAFASSQACFPSLPARCVLPLDFRRIFPQAAGDDVRSLLCLSSVVETHNCEPDHFLAGIERLVEFHRATRPRDEVIHVKRHPYQLVDSDFSDRVIRVLRDRLGDGMVRELPPETAVEAIRWDGDRRLYLGLTSLAIYAHRQGAICYSFAKTIAARDARYRRRLQQQPKAFLDAVEFL